MATIKIKHLILVLGFALSSFSSKGQADPNLEKFAQDFFILLSDTATFPSLEYIRIKTWRQLIGEQDLTEPEKQELEIIKNKEYASKRATFENKLGALVQTFNRMVEQGGQISLAFADYHAHPKWNNVYQCSLKIYYELDEVQNMVNVQYELYYNGRGLLFIGDKLEANY